MIHYPPSKKGYFGRLYLQFYVSLSLYPCEIFFFSFRCARQSPDHAVVDGEDDHDDGEDGQVPRHLAGVPGRQEVVDEDAGDDVDLVGGAHEDEGGDEEVKHWVVRHEDEDACGDGKMIGAKEIQYSLRLQ